MLNMNDKSKVVNLCSYPISWVRITSTGDEWIKGNGATYITNSEIESQIENNNVFLKGIDEIGSHADAYIDNEDFRIQLNFDNKDDNRKQFIVNDDICKQILESKSIKEFKKQIEKSILTTQEKMKIIEYARIHKLNEFDRVKFLEEYCNIKF
jgi:hypothetical protein